MLVIGITGGIASGKSTIARLLARRGIPVVDADQVARRVVRAGSPALAEIKSAFGTQVIGPDGRLDRSALAEIVFSSPTSRKRLERITHPRILRAIARRLAAIRNRPQPPPVAAAVIPLLYEVAACDLVDRVIVAWTSPQEQLRRLISRDRLSPAQARQRIKSQMPLDRKKALADFVVDTSGTFENTERQLDRILNRIAKGDRPR